MLDTLRGTVLDLVEADVLLEVGPLAVRLHMPRRTREGLRQGQSLAVPVVLHLGFDQKKGRIAPTLFGFGTVADRTIFRLLTSVSGIGPSTAMAILDVTAADDIVQAVLRRDERWLQKLKGVGPKTASLLILHLQERIGEAVTAGQPMPSLSRVAAEVVAGLVTLGYPNPEAQRAVQEHVHDHPDDAALDAAGLLQRVLRRLTQA